MIIILIIIRLIYNKEIQLHWKEEEDNFKGYYSEVQKELKLAIVRSIKMIKLIILTRTIHALKTTT